jgi:Transposase DDE domain group 1
VSPRAAAFARDVIAETAPDGKERAKSLPWAAGRLADRAISPRTVHDTASHGITTRCTRTEHPRHLRDGRRKVTTSTTNDAEQETPSRTSKTPRRRLEITSKTWQVNAGWVLAATIAADLAAWTRRLGHSDDEELRDANPETLRYRIWHLPARLARHARDRTLKISPDWPWTDAFVTCWQQLRALPAPA